MAGNRTELKERLFELQEDRTHVRVAIRNILTGKAQSYGIGSRNKAAYSMSLSELRDYLKGIEREIVEIKNKLAGRGARHISFPTFVDPV